MADLYLAVEIKKRKRGNISGLDFCGGSRNEMHPRKEMENQCEILTKPIQSVLKGRWRSPVNKSCPLCLIALLLIYPKGDVGRGFPKSN